MIPIKLPVIFEPDNGGLYDDEGHLICRVPYGGTVMHEQIEQMEYIAKILNKQTEEKGE